MYVSTVFASRVLSRCRNRTRTLKKKFIGSASTMTTADSAARTSYLATNILFTGSSGSFSFRTMRIAKKGRCLLFSFPTESPTSEKKTGAEHLV